ncbi:MAG: ATP-dependent Clp protease ATP-binding subunit ClpC [bacterium (Candidatus Stahlbacteria) CG23_combo_of_CG06-09_8_20_14_all_40_9]|nr:MAG: ATP-dependent Clp protease ATP-binding subunit ClpC [bacterium (Candidatus Stahlbacteria) CG23_combo_of_CG06-09_8_20_14_all_40_9]
MNEKYTPRVVKVLSIARNEAIRRGDDSIDSEHILLGIIKEGEGVAANVFARLGVSIDDIIDEIDAGHNYPDNSTFISISPVLSEDARTVLKQAEIEASELGHDYIGTEHLLLAILSIPSLGAFQILSSFSIDKNTAKDTILDLLGTPKDKKKKSSKTPALDFFTRDITKLAREEMLDPIIGRNEEIERVIQIVCRRKKNNPVLIGEPGVGKTAIVEGIAERIAQGNVPAVLLNKRLLTLDLSLVVAGTKYRGQFEERLKAILQEIKTRKNIILFIDEVHTLVGAGAAEGAIDASNMLKPALAAGEIQCIGATTLSEYRKYIERDGALERRFQPVMVNPPDKESTLKILKGLKRKYEEYHNVIYTDEALKEAVELSDRYITDRFLPDKAIDVIDEAGSRVKLKGTHSKETANLRKHVEDLLKRKEEEVMRQNFELAAKLRDKQKKLEKGLQLLMEGKQLKTAKVVVEDIRKVVSLWTSIPLTRIEIKEQERLLKMESELSKKVVGQDEAIKVIAMAIKRARAGLKDPRRPIGSFIFLGPTGVGKTYLAEKLAEFLFDSESALIKLDMSEYIERFNLSKLIGAPPGYIGYDEGGQLTERMRRRPYSVILFDEIEKAHPDIFNILLQILENGVLTDSFGRHIDFKNTCIILTSNIGTKEIGKEIGFGAGEKVEDRKIFLMSEVKKVFNPEFLNRIDEIVVFNALGKKEMGKIVDILVKEVIDRVKAKGFTVEISSEAKELLIEKGFDPEYGARPLKRSIQRLLEDPLSDKLLVAGKGHILVDRDGESLKFVTSIPKPTVSKVG